MTASLFLPVLLMMVSPTSEISGQPFRSIWRIDPTPLPFAGFRMENRRVIKDFTVLRTALRSEQTVALQNELRFPDGKLHLAAGTRFEVQSSSTMIACTVTKRSSAVWVIFNKGSENVLCLIDSDRDGAFELSFKRKYRLLGYIDVSDRIPYDLKKLQPVGYSSVQPDIDESQPFHQLSFIGYHKRQNSLAFKLETASLAGLARGSYCASKQILIPYNGLETSFEVAGAEFVITAHDPAVDAISITVKRSFSPIDVQCE